MQKYYRMIDANINRTAEGLRVLEDIARFQFTNQELTDLLRNLRHQVRKNLAELQGDCLSARDSAGDIGLNISQCSNLDEKKNHSHLIEANFKRVQEGLRVVEESLKILGFNRLSKVYESLRFVTYDLEKKYKQAIKKGEHKSCLYTDLYCLTAEEYSLGRSNIEVVQEMLKAGIKIIQYREKEKKMLEKYRECLQIRELTRKANATFIVNDHLELALLVKADGVHVGQNDLPLEKVRELAGENMLIGVSTHSPQEALEAIEKGADYIGVGPIFATKTKKDVCSPVGLEYLEYIAKNTSIPFVAIGGIKEHNLKQVLEKGAKCVAMVTEIVGAQDIPLKIQKIREIIKESKK